ncbi:dnaJ homolog subfamily B member 4-like [Benincasa hispida]|uniref:dnaJ homolog subfamily B member 4-like n=1 Tax=Benincasa hispida TaxID=102211 RepID=UPI0018FF38DB|nr:dnaJ homolog subfamily B member 4-like [Benincasa hispida]
MVDLPQALGISFRNFCKSYKSFFKKWHSKAKNSKKDADVVDTKHDATSDAIGNNGPSKDHEEVKKTEGPTTMKSVHSLRYGGQSMRENDATSFRPRSYDSGVSSLSRNASRRGQNPSSTSSSLFRSVSRRSTESVPSRVSSGRRSIDSVSSSPLLSKSGSRMSTTPIMFSNSSGLLKPAPIEKQLECTLEELCFGCMKKIKVTRDLILISGKTMEEEETLTIKIKPGWTKGTKITFEGMGNERPGSYPADMSFVIVEKRHPYFKREGDDLELTVEIPLLKALIGCNISVPLLGGETMSLKIHDVVWPGYEKVIQGQGMPKLKDDKRGNLKVKFLVEFPTELTDQQRYDVCRILEDSDYSK